MGEPTDSPAWRTATHARLSHAVWDDEWVCHHALSNDTHRLSGLAGRALLALAAGSPCNEAMLASGLGIDSGSVAQLLEALESLDFVERCP